MLKTAFNLVAVVLLSPLLASGMEVVGAGDSPALKFAAKDLKRILKDATGKISFVTDPSLDTQEWRLVSKGDDLEIAGRDEMGIVYGVYNFLEDHVGCVWPAQDTECIPDLKGWKMPALDMTRKPAMSVREMFIGNDLMCSVWRLRNRETVRAAFGIGTQLARPQASHTFAWYYKKLEQKHPELVKRTKSKNGKVCHTLCLTDSRVRECVAEEMMLLVKADLEAAKGKPDFKIPRIYDLSQDDGGDGPQCWCDGCRAVAEREGSYSGPMTEFANAVADKVCARYPHVKVQTFAYSYAMDPPKTVAASSNVVIRLCNSRIFHPLLPDTKDGKDMARWSEHAVNLGIWSYWRTYCGARDPEMLSPSLIASELRFCRDKGVIHYFSENEGPTAKSFAMLQHWLFLKLSEDPDRDEKALTGRFMKSYYGAAAKPMTEFLEYFCSRQEESRGFLDRAFFEKVNAWLDEAERLVAGDPLYLRHVRWERSVIDRSMFTHLNDLRKEGFDMDCAATAARLESACIDVISNWSWFTAPNRKASLEKRIRKIREEADLYRHFPIDIPEQFKGRQVVDMHWMQIPLDNSSYVSYVDDPDAVAGKAFYNHRSVPAPPHHMGLYFRTAAGETRHVQCVMDAKDIPQDEKYHLRKVGRDLIMFPVYIYFDRTWTVRHYLSTIGIVPEESDVWVSVKFTGPKFVKGSKQPDRILYDRVLLVK